MSDPNTATDSENGPSEVRVDVWTWAVRLFKTRALAGSACRKEQVLVNGQRCRPARRIRVGDRIEVKKRMLTLTYEVKDILEKRVGAKRVPEFAIDHTPPEVYEEAREAFRMARTTAPQREPGAGRPTKRERRELDRLLEESSAEQEEFEEFVKSFTRGR